MIATYIDCIDYESYTGVRELLDQLGIRYDFDSSKNELTWIYILEGAEVRSAKDPNDNTNESFLIKGHEIQVKTFKTPTKSGIRGTVYLPAGNIYKPILF